jgi:N-acetylmuramoyl-L-alanine amidase
MLMLRRTPFRPGVVLAGCIALAAGVSFAGSSRRPERARAAYERAVALQEQLEAKPAQSRKKADYAKVIRKFHDVYWNDFAYTKAPVAAEAIGDLYADMGRVFSNPSYFQDAVKAYQYLITQYPQSSMARESTLRLAKVYLDDLHDPTQAAEIFQSLLKNHPGSSEASEARKGLREIAHMLAERKEEPSNHSQSAFADEASKGPVEVTDIHDWVGPNYTRVVIGTQSPVKFDALRLTHPDRIVFDLPNTRLNRTLLRKTFPIDGHFLREIRVGQFKPTVTRVVLDVENVEDYSVFPLPNPFRLIIDVHGKTPHEARSTPKRATPSSLAATPSSRSIQAAAHMPSPVPAKKAESSSRTEPRADAGTQAKPGESGTRELASTVPPSPEPGQSGELPISTKPAAPTENGAQTLTRALGLKVARVVIDPGHGGHDTGTIGPTGLEEKNVVLDIALRLRKLFETRTDSHVIMTRTTDKFIPLEERTAIANEKGADLFISIHVNSSPDPRVRGIETYYLNFTTDPEALELAARENATSQESVHQLQSLIKKIALSDKVEESQELARDVQKDLYKDMSRVSHGIHNRGVRKAPFVVLIGANMPSILAEISFLSNPHSERLLRRESYRQKMAEALFQGIVKYMDNLGTIRMAQRTR